MVLWPFAFVALSCLHFTMFALHTTATNYYKCCYTLCYNAAIIAHLPSWQIGSQVGIFCYSPARSNEAHCVTPNQTSPLPFARWLKRLRAQHDLTQEALAELAFCSVQTIRFF
jgi:hypothetical protein